MGNLRQEKILILGAGFHQKDMFVAAKKRNLLVYAVDKNPNAELASLADYFFPISTDDAKELIGLISQEKIAFITTGATFDAILTAAKIKEQLNLPSLLPSSACLEVALDKAKTRAILIKHNLSVPPGGVAATYAQAIKVVGRLHFPIIVKPAYASGSKGTSIIRSLKQLKKAFIFAQEGNQHRKTSTVVFEEMIIGKVLSVEAITIGKRTHTIAAGEINELPGDYSPVVETITPANLSRTAYEAVCTLSSQTMNALGFTNGSTHVNYIVDKDDKPYLIDCNPRLGGGEIVWDSIPRSYKVDLSALVIDLAIGTKPNLHYSFNGVVSGMRRLIAPQSGTFNGLSWSETIKKRLSIGGVYLYMKPGATVTNSPKTTGDLVGCITSWGPTQSQVVQQLREFEKTLAWQID